ncbi:MAG: hypothetical protein HQL13_05200 [Candidatus Omnitrophica bacterium]|nr:hypothetical protein [Candidatus Omnitrophota bacterium]
MRFLLIIIFVACCSSCATWDHSVDNTKEFCKSVWGSSTKALEQARDRAITKTYDKPYWDCVKGALRVVNSQGWIIFKKQESQGYMVVMGITGCVNTTEVGIFFVKSSEGQTRIEISSLSTNAKRKVAKGLFHGLDALFGLPAS